MEWIDNIILGLIETYSTTNIYELCDHLNIRIVKLEKDSVLLCKKDAFYNRNMNGMELIFIRNDLDERLEEFILKHELGHALCHPNVLDAAYTFSNTGKLERQANYFAFKLTGIHLDRIELKGMTLKQISSYINIPYETMKQLYSIL